MSSNEESTSRNPPTNSSSNKMALESECAEINMDNSSEPAEIAHDVVIIDEGREEKEKEEEEYGQPKKGAKTSTVWLEFNEITLPNGEKKGECIHCKMKLSITASGSTSHFGRHLKSCIRRKIFQNQQQRLSFEATQSDSGATEIRPALVNGKFDISRMREATAHWIMMHEHPFSIMEEEGFNIMQKHGMPEWERVPRVTIKKDCMQVCESKKKKLKNLLKNVDKISLTTDLRKSSNQKIECMVLTAHFIDSSWRLQKRVINFVHIPPPRRGVEIADCIFNCLKEWGIENKVFTISVGNASSNDVAIRVLNDTFGRNKKLICGGKLFHVRCCAHILNLMVQDVLSSIEHIIEDIHDSVKFINQNEARLSSFSSIVQQLQLPHWKLILDCKTHWNSTFEMLSNALKFKEVFPRFQDREPLYHCCPRAEDWEKVEKICDLFEVFNACTNIISGSDYPTSNLFLGEVHRIKVLLDKREEDEDEDDFIRAMVGRMKNKFDKYWGVCNLLMAVAAILDPRSKMRAVEFCFRRLYSENEVRENIGKVRDALYQIYAEYVQEYQHGNEQNAENQGENSGISSKIV